MEALTTRRRGGGSRVVLLAAAAGVSLLAAGCGGIGFTSAKGDKQHGKQLFSQKCGGCHTLQDAGTTGAIGPDLDAAFSMARATGMTESTIRQVVRGQIAYAITDTSTGAPGMPKNLVKGQDARDVAVYVASVAGLSTAAATPPATTPPAATSTAATTTAGSGGGSAADVAAGKKVFLDAGCGGCHTLKDAGSGGNIGPNLDQLKPDAARVKRQVINGGGPMPSFKDQLSAKQIDDVAAYVSSVAGR